ncbi:MAG: PSD1 and planctomycete cytochrome C domain-containing protein [Planctomycetota bacterium]
MNRSCWRTPFALSLIGIASVAWGGDRIDFNRDVRPLLNQHCVACHGGVKQAGDLSFVYEEPTRQVIEPGDPDGSYLIDRVISRDAEERMPPPDHGRALNDQEIDTLRQWIRQGGQWGDHWAFLPPRLHDPPTRHEDEWSRDRVDRFVFDRLTAAELQPNPEASPERWLRRVSLDLVGMPPTPRERKAFLESIGTSGELAYRSEVNRLLGSHGFGERWASVWLDAVRYADSRGLGQDGRRTIWKYRDWVIRALNDDVPYDQFTIRQLAGDLLPEPTMDDLVATACNRLTQTNEEGGTDDEMFRVEAVIDRVNTTWQTWQGISFGCVQCHSHPYDPIRHDEYYRFAAYFNNTQDCDLSSEEPTVAVPVDDAATQQAIELDREIKQLWDAEWRLVADQLHDESSWMPLLDSHLSTNNSTRVDAVSVDGVEEIQTRGNVARQTTVVVDAAPPESVEQLTAIRFTGLPSDLVAAEKDSEWGFVLSHIKASRVSFDGETQPLEIAFVLADEPDPILDPQLSLNAKNSKGFAAYSRIHFPRSAAFILAKPLEIKPGDRLKIAIAQDVFELGAFPLVVRRMRLAVSDSKAWTGWWTGEERVEMRQRLGRLRKQRSRIQSVKIPIMSERPAKFRRPMFVFTRGNYLDKSDAVDAGVPTALLDADLPPDRLAMAKWIASPENPLTARVAVNRIWAQLFGIGLVETQEDFGSAGAAPSHPLLLDDLAARFQTKMGWSLKTLLRELVLSSTYRQSSRAEAATLEPDPRNRLLSRGPRGRLPAESVRDQALAVSGLLSRKAFGPPVHPPIPDGVWDPFQSSDKWNTPSTDDPDRYRRTVYTYTKRSIPYPVMASFDAPSREFCSMRRLPSNTPLQALMTLNDQTFVEASQALANRMRNHDCLLRDQLAYGFSLAVCRNATPAEMTELLRLHDTLSHQHDSAPLVTIANVLLNLDEVLTK